MDPNISCKLTKKAPNHPTLSTYGSTFKSSFSMTRNGLTSVRLCSVKACMNNLQFDFRTCSCIDRHLRRVGERERERDRFLCVPGKRDGREMANQRTAAVAVPCCTTAIPPCEGYISSRQFITWSAWLPQQRVAASCEVIDRPPFSLPAGGSARLTGSCKMFQCCDDDLWIQLRY